VRNAARVASSYLRAALLETGEIPSMRSLELFNEMAAVSGEK
jgi:hypothetical protein